jgi:FkbM family methyltransferase
MKNRITSFLKHISSIGLIQTILYLLQRIFIKKGNLISIKINGLKRPLLLRNKFYDTHIFYQIFIDKEVDFQLDASPKIIIDCGANIGLTTLYFKMKYPNSKIYSIEPESSNFDMLFKNTHEYDNIIQLNAAVWYEDKQLEVIDDGVGHASFQVADDSKNTNIIGKVNTITLFDLIEKYNINNIDLLKLDIEGSEYEIFYFQKNDWLQKTNNLIIEIHEAIKPGSRELIENTMKNNFYKSTIGEYSLFKMK